MKKTLIALAVAAAVLTCGSLPLKAQRTDKLTRADEILQPLRSGKDTTRVIVTLAPPIKTMSKQDWQNPQHRAAHRATVLTQQKTVLGTISKAELELRHRFENQPGFSAQVTAAGLEQLQNNPEVVNIEPVEELELHLAQGIPLMDGDVFRGSYDGQGVSVAIVDTGVDYTHSALGNGSFPNSKVIDGYDFGEDDVDPMPNLSAHGTACAGIAAGDLSTGTGDYIGGVAPSAKIIALKVSDASGSLYSDKVIAAWDWCITHKDDDPANPILVISNSLGSGRYTSMCDSSNSSYANAAENVVNAGITILASSGNEGYCDAIARPACVSSIISVGAVYDDSFSGFAGCVSDLSCVTPSDLCSSCEADEICYADLGISPDDVTSYSNSASYLDVLAPGSRTYTTDIVGSSGYTVDDYYSSFGGTSAACPYAAGAVACLQSAMYDIHGRYLTPDEVKDLLTSAGEPVLDDKSSITTPRVNIALAIDSIMADFIIDTFPYSQNFDTFDTCYADCATECALDQLWVNSTDDDADWLTQKGPTPSANTGPSFDHTTMTSIGHYLYVEASSPCTEAQSILLSPIFDFTDLSYPALRFYAHLYGADTGTFTVQMTPIDIVNWQTLYQIIGDQGDQWFEIALPLTAAAGSQIQLRFIALTGSNYRSDMAIDDVWIGSDITAYCSILPGDFQPDCAVDLIDLSYFSSYWLADCNDIADPNSLCDIADMDLNDYVDLNDFSIFSQGWLQ